MSAPIETRSGLRAGGEAVRTDGVAEGLPAPLAWAGCGAMSLTAFPGDAPSLGPARLAAWADAAATELCLRVGLPGAALDGAALLGERAAAAGLTRRGRVSPGGSCRLLATARGDLAVNLARADDLALLPAWLERGIPGECSRARPGEVAREPWHPPAGEAARAPWHALEAALGERPAAHWVERGRLLGLAVAEACAPAADPGPGVRVAALGEPGVDVAAFGGPGVAVAALGGPGVAVAARGAARPRGARAPLVMDLSSLWAGPLCAQLLALAGARVVKVESTGRPDGARRGPARFFDLLNGHKASVALDFTAPGGRDALRRLLARADVVIEASRPRALRQLGIDAKALLAERPGRVWVSITGHGRSEPNAGWAGFGDDAATAAGLAVAAGGAGPPIFCADAVADPLAGLAAALATVRALASGGGVLLDVSLAAVARHALGPFEAAPRARVFAEDGTWWVACEGRRARVAAPRMRRPTRRARPLGADTAAWT